MNKRTRIVVIMVATVYVGVVLTVGLIATVFTTKVDEDISSLVKVAERHAGQLAGVTVTADDQTGYRKEYGTARDRSLADFLADMKRRSAKTVHLSAAWALAWTIPFVMAYVWGQMFVARAIRTKRAQTTSEPNISLHGTRGDARP